MSRTIRRVLLAVLLIQVGIVVYIIGSHNGYMEAPDDLEQAVETRIEEGK